MAVAALGVASPLLTHWQRSVTQAAADLGRLTDTQARHRPAPGKWSIKEIVGHLIDSAANNHRRFVEAQFQDALTFPGWRPVPRTEPATLGDLIDDYVAHLEHHLGQARRLVEQDPSDD